MGDQCGMIRTDHPRSYHRKNLRTTTRNMDRRKRHNHVIRQRVLAFIITILVLGGLTAGAVYGAIYVRDSGLLDKIPRPQPAVEEPSSEEPSTREDDSWIAVEKEVIEDDYADVDTSVLEEPEEPTEVEEPEEDDEIEAIISSLALEEKVAQLFIVTPEQITGMAQVTRAGETTQNALTEYPVGGLIYFDQNFEDPDQTREMLENTRQYIVDACGIEPFLAVDEEGGSVTRIAGNDAFDVPQVDAMGKIGKEKSSQASYDAYSAGETIGTYLSGFGLNLDFAPVADVLTDKTSEVIGDRSFGSDPQVVSDLSRQFASGISSKGVTPCFKHFPGHGSVGGDTHETAVSQEATLEELYDSDLIPFKNAIENDAKMIMASHIACPTITGDDVPTSLSPVMLSGILRGEMGYDGIIITDSFQMDAVKNKYPDPGEAAVAAIKAGADIVLMPADFHEAYNAVLSAASAGEIEEDKINDSLRRILTVKLGK